MTGNSLSKKFGFEPKEAALGNWPEVEQKFMLAPEVKEMGRFLINKFKTELQNVNIQYVFKQKASKNGDSITMGSAKAESDLQKVLHGFDALVIIGFDTWQALELDEKLRLCYHELCHIGMNLDGSKITMLPHPIEEFPEVVQHFGPGNNAQIAFISAYKAFCKDNNQNEA